MKYPTFLFLLAGGLMLQAQTEREGSNSGGDASARGPVSGPTERLNYQTDLFTGRFGYQVPFALAPGRHDSEPDLALGYSSAGESGWCGVGWDLDFGYIQRETKRGVPVLWTNGVAQKRYDDGRGFVFSLNGKGAALVRTGTNEYRAEIEGGFLRFQLLTNLNQWQVTDPGGNRYFFGVTNNSRMSNSKAGWSSNAWTGTYRWALARVETVLGDTTDYSYTNIGGMLYPRRLGYNGHINGLTNTHTVDFILGARSDVRLGYQSGFRVEQSRRLDALVHKVSGQVVWSNRLNYAQSSSTTRSLLKSITRYGTNLTSSLPPVVFDYTVQQFGFQPAVNWTNLYIPPSYGWPNYYSLSTWATSSLTGWDSQVLDLLDMDGDGLPDRVFQNSYYTFTNLWVQRNNGAGFDNPAPIGPLSVQTWKDNAIDQTTSNKVEWAGLNSIYLRMLDINGDGLPDRVADPLESLSGQNDYRFNRLMVQLNGGTNWLSVNDVPWTNVWFSNYVAGDTLYTDYRVVERNALAPQVMMIDMNGDGLPDRLMARLYGEGAYKLIYTNYWVQFNTGTGFTGTNALTFPAYETYTPLYGKVLNSDYVRLLDINGDGLPDRVMYPTNTATGMPEPLCSLVTNYVVEYNNGCGFEPPVYVGGFIGQYTDAGGTYRCTMALQDNAETAFRDINCDGLPDRLIRYHQYLSGVNTMTNWLVQINQGTNFAPAVLYGPYYSQNQFTENATDYTGIQGTYGRLMDMNGDGIPDHVMRSYPDNGYNAYHVVELSKGPVPDLLNTVSNGIGGSVSLSYKSSTQYNNRESTSSASKHLLPFPMQTVASISASDGLYPSNTTTYLYEGGKWNAARREFDGFARTVVVDPLGLTNIHWFHQAGGRENSALGEYQDSATAIGKKGMTFRAQTIGTNGQLYKVTLNKVEDADLGNGRHFAYVSQTLALDYPGSTDNYRATAQQYFYNLSTGNLTNKIDFGEVTSIAVTNHSFADVPGDTVYQFTAYATLANTNILDRPQRETLTADSAGLDVLRETLCDYDGNTGSLTRQRERICSGSYTTNGFGYDAYNNQTRATNEAGIVTTTVYDSAYQTFSFQQTEGGTFTSSFKYDPRSGSVLLSTNVAGLVTSNAYDAFLRVIETAVSTNANGVPNQWLARYDYRLGMKNGFSTNSVRVRQNDGVDLTNGHETWTYSDGLGRVVQTRVEAETGSYRVTDTVYDKRGGVQFVSLAYFSTGTNHTKAVTGLGALTEYDPVARPSKVTPAVTGTFTSGLLTATTPTSGDTGSPAGPATIAYNDGNDPWTLVLTDEESKVHKYSLDAYGRTNQIVEVTSLGNYTTLLRYNLAGDLTNITDQAANQIQYAYNDLGQMVAMADPDMGRWDYKRDFAGRLREQVDAKTNVIRFDYTDALGRLKARQVYDPRGVFVSGVTNFYDTSDDANFPVSAGQLYKTTDSEGWTKNGFDVRGRAIRTARHLSQNGNTYTNQFTYDNADRVILSVYPNGGPVVTNIFDTGGNLSQVKQVGGSNTVFYAVTGFNARRQLIGVNFGNGVVTTNDYFTNSLRLRRMATFKSGSTNIQDLTHTYDRASNVKSIADGVYSTNASAALSAIVYDDLHRLTSLTRPAVGQTTTFSYNSIGNILVNGENGAGSYGYGVRMPHAVKSAGGRNYAYDQNGNMIVRDNQRLAYDPENRLTNIITPAFTVAFGYDAAGARLWKQSTNSLQVWIGDNYEEKDGKILFHIFGGGRTVCTFDKTGTNVFVYYHPDHLHSTAIETDRNGNRSQHYEYMAYGQDRFTESVTAFPVSKRYTSHVKDEDTGLYYYGARYYDPVLGRFIQPDTTLPSRANPQHLNRYSYVLNNPLKHDDPEGKSEYNVVARAMSPPPPPVVIRHNFNFQPLQISASFNAAQSAPGPVLKPGDPGATLYSPRQPTDPTTYNALLPGAQHLVGTQVGEQMATINADMILNAPGTEMVAAKLGKAIQALRGSAEAAETGVGLETRGLRPLPGTRQIPEGIPEGWRIRPNREKPYDGTWYYAPANKGNSVRVMQGDPASPFPNSQAPYVRWQQNGQALDINGNIVLKNTPDAHIPLQDFKFNP